MVGSMPPPSDFLPTGDRRQFHIHNCLGSGGFGEVYRATMKSAGGVQTEVAVKVLHATLDAKSQAVQRLRDEGKLLGILNHPAILRVTDLVSLEGRIALVTEYVEGADLAECFIADEPISLRATLQVIAQIADALNAAYTTEANGEPLGLVHRDIKPANIRIGRHGDVKLLDFGIARTDSFDREAKTQTNTVIGSFAYMAPERFERHETVELAGDVYSLGCVLFERLTGTPFFDDIPLRKQYIYALNSLKYLEHLETQLERTRAAPNEVQVLLRRLLSYDPSMRPANQDLVHLCEDIADNLSGTPLRRWCRSRAWPESHDEDAPFSGRVITESTLSSTRQAAQHDLAVASRANQTGITLATDFDLSTSDQPVPSNDNDRRTHLLLGGFALTISLLVMAVIVATGVAIFYANSANPFPESSSPPSTAVDTPAPAPAIQDAAMRPRDASVNKIPPAEVPRAPAPAITTPASESPRRASKPPPEAQPARSQTDQPVAPSTWSIKGSVEAELRAGSTQFSPGEVPPGDYTIWANFPGGWVSAGRITLDPGAQVTVQCFSLKYQCTEIN